nr:phage tail protein [Paenibacillus sinopodophylli]
MLKVYDKNLVAVGVLPDAIDVQRTRRLNSDYEISFTLPMNSEDYDKIQIKGHVQDERGQYYVINDRSRKRDGEKRLVQFDCMHVIFKLSDIKFPYAAYMDEGFGINIVTLLNNISAATGGKFTFSLDDTFDLQDVKDFGRGNCLQALNKVIEIYGCEIEPDNFVIHIKKQIGMDRGLQYRFQKNIINVNFKDSSRTLATRMFSQMKDGRTFIGLSASNLTTEERALLNAVPGAIVSGEIKVNYLISPYAAYWSNTTNTYFDNEIINQDIEDPLELLKATRKALRENEVPAIDVTISAADLHKIDDEEPEIYLGDTVAMFDAGMQINGITARAMEVVEYPYENNKHPDVKLANYFLRDYMDIIADLDKSKQVVDNLVSGGKVRTAAFESFAAQAVNDINNSKSEIIYDERGIVLRSKLIPNDQVVLSSKGMYITRDGGFTAEAAITAEGILAPKVIGKLGNFVEIEIGIGNNVFKANQSGIHLGHQAFGSSPFRVNMTGELVANMATIAGEVHATSGSFSGNINAYGTITGGTLTGAKIQTKAAGVYPRIELNSDGDLLRAYYSGSNYVGISSNLSSTPGLEFIGSNIRQGAIYSENSDLYIGASNGNLDIIAWVDVVIRNVFGVTRIDSWNKLFSTANSQTLQQALNDKVGLGASTSSHTQPSHNHGIPEGTRLAVVNSSGVVTGSVIFSASGGFTHYHTI